MRAGFLGDVNTDPSSPWYDSLAATLASTATALLPVYQQKELMDINADRLRQGLPPIDISQYSAGVNVGLSADTKQLLIYGAGGAAILIVLGMFMSRRK